MSGWSARKAARAGYGSRYEASVKQSRAEPEHVGDLRRGPAEQLAQTAADLARWHTLPARGLPGASGIHRHLGCPRRLSSCCFGQPRHQPDHQPGSPEHAFIDPPYTRPPGQYEWPARRVNVGWKSERAKAVAGSRRHALRACWRLRARSALGREALGSARRQCAPVRVEAASKRGEPGRASSQENAGAAQRHPLV